MQMRSEILEQMTKTKSLTPIRAIRTKCLQCTCGQIAEIRQCNISDCALYPYRMGHRPKQIDTLSTDIHKAKKTKIEG